MNTSTFSDKLYANPKIENNQKHYKQDLFGHNLNTDESVGMISDFMGTAACWTNSSGKGRLLLLEYQIA